MSTIVKDVAASPLWVRRPTPAASHDMARVRGNLSDRIGRRPGTCSTRSLEQCWVEGTRSIEGCNRSVSLEKDGTVASHTPDLWTPINGGADR
jgi:hypothetical protein